MKKKISSDTSVKLSLPIFCLNVKKIHTQFFNAYILVEQASSIALLHAKPGSTLLALCYYSAMWQLCAIMMSWVSCLLTDLVLPDTWN